MGQSDQRWFDEIYVKYAPLVLRHAKSLYRSFPWLPNDPEDIVQEVFMCLYENREKIYDPEGISYWLMRVTQNKAFDYEDEQKRRSRLIDDYASIDRAANVAEKDDMEALDLEYYIELCEKRIGKKNFEIMQAYYTDREESKKIAEREGMSPGALRVQIHRWRKACAEVIKKAAGAEMILLVYLLVGKR